MLRRERVQEAAQCVVVAREPGWKLREHVGDPRRDRAHVLSTNARGSPERLREIGLLRQPIRRDVQFDCLAPRRSIRPRLC